MLEARKEYKFIYTKDDSIIYKDSTTLSQEDISANVNCESDSDDTDATLKKLLIMEHDDEFQGNRENLYLNNN